MTVWIEVALRGDRLEDATMAALGKAPSAHARLAVRESWNGTIQEATDER
jgi:hypothetical protein